MRARKSGAAVGLWGVLLAVCAAAPVLQNPPPTAPQSNAEAQGYKIAGMVVNAVTGAPLARVKVSVADTRARARRIETITGEGGHFEFRGLPAGKYALQGTRTGYLASAYQQHEQFSTAIVTGPELDTEKLVLRLMPMAMIAGHVMDEVGEPVRRAQVQLYMEDHSEGMSRVVGAGGATSDDRGYFDIGVLRPGTYFFSVNAKPWYAVYPPGENSGQRVSRALDVAYPTTFYRGATEAEGATPIELKGGERQEIEIRLSPVPALRLIFRAPEEGQFQMPILQKRVFDSVQMLQLTQTRSMGPGVFELMGVPAGSYDVRTGSQGPAGTQVVSEMNLTHDGQDLTEIKGEALGTLKVTVKIPGEEQLPGEYAVALRDGRRRLVAFQAGQPSGEVTFEALKAGKYGIVFLAPGKRYAVERIATTSGEAIGHHEVDIRAGASTEVTTELVAGEVRIEGVAEKNGKPVAGVMVALVPGNPESNVDLFRRDQSDFDGTFTLAGVVPGTYTIVAVEDAWGFEWLKEGVLSRYVQHGQNVIVGDKMKGTVHLPDAVEVQGR
jgi:uncharacterized protein (DUF2141 family)